ncbi:protein SPEAR1-like [Salvia splendens]|uniref:protein SPEAR1-like n=1 Tax=Salvia splendens TaxID=180675 RepID=UPI001C25AD4A|nr:protein SPEAR1-like [Salvia splendens]
MGSNYFGGSERGSGGLSSSSSSSSSSRKGKKSGSDKPKQPQRGLGVAQLEKIRLHSQLGNTYLPSVHHNPYASNLYQEDVRMQSTHSSTSPSPLGAYGYQGHHGVMMGLPDLDRANLAYGDSQPTNVARWNHHSNAGYETQHFVEPNMTRSFFELPAQVRITVKIEQKSNQILGSNNMNMSSQNSDSSSSQDIDLELKLSL